MKNKKIILIISSILISMMVMNIPIKSSAKQLNPSIYFGVNEFREEAPDNMGYGIWNPNGNGTTADNGALIWQIQKYPSLDSNNGSTGNYYCVKAGIGFSSTNKKMEYSNSYDFKTDRNEILGLGGNVLPSIVRDDYYYKILALSDLLYLKGTSDTEEKEAEARSSLLEAAGINLDEYKAIAEYYKENNKDVNPEITDSDIDAVQQAAIWYFTNHENTMYNNLGKGNSGWLTYNLEGNSQYDSLSGYQIEYINGNRRGGGECRQEQMVQLYEYLINTAEANSGTIKAEYEAGRTHDSRTKITLYTNVTAKDSTQPIILLEREPEIIIEELEFDLSLRKYITKIDGVSLTGGSSRVPSINTNTLSTGTTATYKHKKDPVVVETGSVVTYNLEIYNEGEQHGRATKIVDQLPTGLEFKRIITKGFSSNYNLQTNRVNITREYGNERNLAPYNGGDSLDSEIIEIECVVTEKPDSRNSKILTNVAWIEEEFNAEEGITITTQEELKGADRDSIPAGAPRVNKDSMADYIGNSKNSQKADLSDSNYYYEGQEDDDDFEKLVLEPAAFDLKLIKRIVEVNGTKVPERLLNVDITELKNGTKTTADYQMDKEEPVNVKKGDLVKYALRVYNEGDIDGYASEITEDIPEGLEFLWSEKTDDELQSDTTLTQEEKDAIEYNQGIWDIKTVNKTTNRIEMITTDYLAKGKGAELENTDANLIKAFDSSKDYVNTVNNKNPDYREVSVILKVVSNDATGTIIRNEAAITEDTDSEGNPIDDRDSDTEEWVKYEDDEDYDNVKLQAFDLALRKFIIAVSDDTTIQDSEYLKNADGTYTRAPKVDTSKLNTIDEDGEMITTAIYNHTKEPVAVEKGDIVVYMLRVYNEGDLDGYASEIKDHLPPYLQYVDSEFNRTYGWTPSDDGRTVTTTYLDNHKVLKPTIENGKIVLVHKEVPIMCRVIDTAKVSEKITNIADITLYKDENKKPIEDRDSEQNDVVLPLDTDLPSYKDNETGTYIPGQQDDDDFEKVIIKSFDLALRKFITQIEGKDVTTRIPKPIYNRENNQITYQHSKDPLLVSTNDIVVYTIRVYNEGEKDGYASRITDDLPEGIKYLPENEINRQYRWVMYDNEGRETTEVSKATKITTDYLSKEQGEARRNGASENPALLNAFDGSKEISETNPDYADVKVAFKVTESSKSKRIIINSAQISDDTNKDGKPIDDIDSTPDEWIEGEDDQDKEYIKLKSFDLALRKFITQIEGKDVTSRIPQVKYNNQNNKITYEHSKEALEVAANDIIVYTIRVYNEGETDGFASRVSDDLPEGIKYLPDNQINRQYRWVMYDSEGKETQDVAKAVKVTTDYLSKEQGEARRNGASENPALLKAFDGSKAISETNPDHAEVKIAFKVTEPSTSKRVIINSAQISEDTDSDGEPIDDIDSTPDQWIEGEDDQDKEYIKLKPFDLALRKFITGVNDEKVTTRIPQIKYDKEKNQITYDHTKEPVEVATTDIVVYTIRVYNEGEVNGYASKVSDDIPQGLEYLPENELNKEYRWVMFDSEGNETTEVSKATKITTDYLSKEQGEERMKKASEEAKTENEEDSSSEESKSEENDTEKDNSQIKENPALLKAFDKNKEISETNPDYADVQVAFRVTEPNTSEKIIINSAQISEDTDDEGEPIDDIDSTPDEWNDGEDDQDKEYIKVQYFDLALRKWVTQAIVIENGKESITQTGHTPEQDPEPVVKVELNRKKLNSVVVKFRYSIRVTNEGDIAGYAKEITDYVPQGLKFVAEDNDGWKDEGNNVISTRLLENTLLQPGESADVEVLLTWINATDNMGLKTNIAEISEDYNDKGIPDIDSTPDNKKDGEDDIDDAPVLLSISTGQARVYFVLGFAVLITLVSGIVLIKRFVM